MNENNTGLAQYLIEAAREAAFSGRVDEAEELLLLRVRLAARQFDLNQLALPLEKKAA